MSDLQVSVKNGTVDWFELFSAPKSWIHLFYLFIFIVNSASETSFQLNGSDPSSRSLSIVSPLCRAYLRHPKVRGETEACKGTAGGEGQISG